MKKKIDCHVTINGQPLSEFLEENSKMQIESCRVNIITGLRKTIYRPRKKTGMKTGRTAGNPGVKKAHVYSPEEIESLNNKLKKG